ncbi:hypothetical protein C7974DRAFT_425960 [Boeremia exigua]|uniref:uncharacterized protein n=1 Tax=Boeremia exigua TaxID=749465 RepID=UPI001E8D2B3E|nr:uncharacterized protein C7974DRAFT_425960 [Boeremia exigua]KAH6622259.1 hypothetical protein C7974DRAFT_425960 [Boeremia exigua]
MPPKKASNASNGADASAGKIIWEGANDTKLLLLTQGRYVKPEEYAELASVFAGVSTGGIRNRISALRVKQRNLYESLGWKVPDGGAGHSSKKAASSTSTPSKYATPSKHAAGGTPSKRATPFKLSKRAFDAGDDDSDADGVDVDETPSKKRTKNTTPSSKSSASESDESEGGDWNLGAQRGVKKQRLVKVEEVEEI